VVCHAKTNDGITASGSTNPVTFRWASAWTTSAYNQSIAIALSELKGYATNPDLIEPGHCHTQRPSRHAPPQRARPGNPPTRRVSRAEAKPTYRNRQTEPDERPRPL